VPLFVLRFLSLGFGFRDKLLDLRRCTLYLSAFIETFSNDRVLRDCGGLLEHRISCLPKLVKVRFSFAHRINLCACAAFVHWVGKLLPVWIDVMYRHSEVMNIR
jgi:hypothetical protein